MHASFACLMNRYQFLVHFAAVDECYGGVMLCVDVTHRVLRQTAVLEVLQHAYRSARGNMADFQKNVEQAIVGCVVLTR